MRLAVARLATRMAQLLWPSGLGGRTILVLSAAVVVVHLGTVALYHDRPDQVGDAFAGQITGRLTTATRALIDADPARRDRLAHTLSSPTLDLHWSDHPIVVLPSGENALPGLRNRMAELAPNLGSLVLQFGSNGSTHDETVLNGSVRLPDDTFLNFASTLTGSAPLWKSHATLFSTTSMAIGVVGVAALLVRGLIQPLRRLAAAADAIGGGPDVIVGETGPREVRHVARAFNRMQRRLRRLVDDRTEALAAVSHDLRTPITRLRLRAGFLRDAEAQAAVDADLDEMESMIEATLAYLRGDLESEPKQVTDLATLLSTLVDHASDAGADAIYQGPNHLAVSLFPSLVRRAFANLINNAITHGGSARVTLIASETGIRVTVEDGGPGIPEEDLERVLQPFYRLDASRNRATGGVGLGLAIARRGIEHDGGQLRLANRCEGGLRATISLPSIPAGLPDYISNRNNRKSLW